VRDITIIYQGGSGGFLFYYYLMLTREFYNSESAKFLVDMQYPDSLKGNRTAWKAYEYAINNVELKRFCTEFRKLYLICNPLFNHDMLESNIHTLNNTTKILLYTDLRTQLRMAYDKKAYWFTDVSRKEFNAPESNYKYIRSILKSGVQFRGELVDPVILDVIKKFGVVHIVSLRTLLKRQTELVDKWIDLQSEKAILCLKK
jgi:hypothetical protein